MSIYVDKVHIYCDQDNCDNETILDNEEIGSIDFCRKSEYDSITAAVSDFAFICGWYFEPFTNEVFCPSCDKKFNHKEQKGSHLWTGEV